MLSVKTENGFKPVSILASTAGLAEKYNPASSYAVGDYCTYNMALYKCTASTTGTWDSTKWTQVYVTDELETAVSSHADRRDNPHVVTTTQIGAVPDDRTVQGHALSSNVTLWEDYTATLYAYGWSGSGPYTRAVNMGSIFPSDKPFVDLNLSSAEFADIPNIIENWGLIYRVVASLNILIFYATDKPTSGYDMPIKVRCFR